MKLNRRHIRKLILREMAEMTYDYKEIPQHIGQKAQQIGNGYIIDVGAMEGSGGGNYPGYVVENGLASLDKEHVSTFEEYVFLLGDYGKNNVHIHPDQKEYAAGFDQPIVNPLQNKPAGGTPDFYLPRYT